MATKNHDCPIYEEEKVGENETILAEKCERLMNGSVYIIKKVISTSYFIVKSVR